MGDIGNDPAVHGVRIHESPGGAGQRQPPGSPRGRERTQMTITTTEAPAVPVQRTGSTSGQVSLSTARPEMSAEDLDAQSPAADLVRVYLNGIGKTALLTAAQEVDLARRIEAGVFAQHVLDSAFAEGTELDRQYAADLRAVVRDGARARNHL